MSTSKSDMARQLGLLGLVTNDPGMSATGQGVIDQANTADSAQRAQAALEAKQTWQQQLEQGRDLRQQRMLDSQDDRADARMSAAMGRWQLKKIPTPDGFKYVQMNSLTGEIKDPPTDLNQDAGVGVKAKQDAAALEAAANRVEALAKTASPAMFSRGGDMMRDVASSLPIIGDVAANTVRGSWTPEKMQFNEQETAANALTRRALEGAVGTDESRRQMKDAYPYTSGTTYNQFMTNAPAFVDHLRSMAAAKRSANYNPNTGEGGPPPPPMGGVPQGGIQLQDVRGYNGGGAAQAAPSASGPVYQRINGKLVQVQ